MVEVRVRDDDEIDRPHVERRRGEVLCRGVLAALEEPAVDQERGGVRLDQAGAAGHFAGGAEEGDAHSSRSCTKGGV